MEFAGAFLKHKNYDLIVAVDAGLESAKSLGLIPHVVVGDFDTVSSQVLEEYQRLPDIIWEIHNPEKNETDTELAVHTAMNMGAGEITILGGTGGRMDHMLGNLQLMAACLKQGVSACLIDSQNKVYLLKEGKSFWREELWGKYISFLPFTQKVHGITLKGFYYPLNQRNITMGEEAGLCISNELSEDRGSISFTSGILICVESRD